MQPVNNIVSIYTAHAERLTLEELSVMAGEGSTVL